MRSSFDQQGRFILRDYNRSKSFASFLPAVAGRYGIPLWCFYVNRGQAVISLGVKDKNHSILEFYPANKAYEQVFYKGFRTFIKSRDLFYEPFAFPESRKVEQDMYVHPAYLVIQETNRQTQLNTKVTYFTLPSQPVACLIRIIEITNLSNRVRNLQVLDGIPCVIPFGANHSLIKNMSRTLEAWMDSFLKNNVSFFKLSVSPEDVAHTQYIKGANFYFSFVEQGNVLKPAVPLIDKSSLFQEDVDLFIPHKFKDKKFRPVYQKEFFGRTPAAFTFLAKKVAPGKHLKIVSFLGSVKEQKKVFMLVNTINKKKVESYFYQNKELIESLQDKAFVKSGIPEFDNYIKQSYLDNFLRGGFPQEFRNHSIPFIKYLYSRKHGDLERDYNDFKIEDTYYSSGEGNFRDINQNRRCDNYFSPYVGRDNIRLFFNLQRADSYNPLRVKPYSFTFPNKIKFKSALSGILDQASLDKVWQTLGRSFVLGELIDYLEQAGVSHKKQQACILKVLSQAQKLENADFGEGFWIDHWTYNLDLIENYLSFFPDREKDLFFEKVYSFYDDAWKVNPRQKRFKIKGGRVLQQDFLFFDKEKQAVINQRKELIHRLRVRSTDKVLYTCLWVKLLVVVLNKISSLDPEGRGIEMEAGKPGWCDAMNGLPALNGSSLAETLELKRLAIFMKDKIGRYRQEKVSLPLDIYEFFFGLRTLLAKSCSNGYKDTLAFWDGSNSLKEHYRAKIFKGAKGGYKKVGLTQIKGFLDKVIEKLDFRLKNIKSYKHIPTYFINQVTDYSLNSKGKITALRFKQRELPLFLEGFVRACKVLDKDRVEKMYDALNKSCLYDRKLKMFKVNASLKKEPLEIGRIRVFKAGWLENESIWLHMEYKYILELLKKDLNRQFYKEFFRCLVCFLNPDEYGRNPAENSSFIASSVYLNKQSRGQGFVARLTGSTVEVLNMLVLMTVGKQPFFIRDGELFLRFRPLLKAGLFTSRKTHIQTFIEGKKKSLLVSKDAFCFKFLGDTLVIYRNPNRKDTYSQSAEISKIDIKYKDGRSKTIFSSVIPEPDSKEIRDKKAETIEIFIK